MSKKLACIFALVLCLVLVSTLGFTAGSKRIAYVAQSAFASNYSLAIYYGMVDSIKKAGYEPVIYNPDFDGAKQVSMIEDIIAEGDFAGIVVHPIDPILIVNSIKKANAAKIPMVGIVSQAEGGDLICTVKNDVLAEGKNAAEVVAKELKKRYGEVKGLVLEVHGGLQDDVAKGRSKGYHDYMKQYPKVKTITREATGWSIPLAEQVTRDVLTANPNVDAIYSHADYFNDAIEAGILPTKRLLPRTDPKHIIWTSIDGNPTAYERIRKGIMDQTSSAPCYSYGGWAVKFLVDFIQKGIRPKVGETLTQKNVDWSPAKIVAGNSGPVMLMTPFNVTAENVDTPYLWGNREWKKPE
jgi:ABC-type sugar transport system substrate-binding protein